MNNYIHVNRKTKEWGIFEFPENHNEKFQKASQKINPFKHLSFVITNLCNLSCRYCYKEDNKEREILNKNSIFNFINLIEKNYPKSISSVQLIGGEPFLHPNILEILDFLIGKNYEVRISTNGTLDILRDARFKAYLDNENIELRISLDSHNENIHDNFRGKGSFKSVLSNIEYLKKYKCYISVKSVVTKNNILELENMIKFIKELGIDSFIASTLYNLGDTDNQFYSENYVSLHELTSYQYKLLDKDISYSKILFPNMLRNILECLFMENASMLTKMNPVINYDGSIYPQDQLINNKFNLGNIKDISKSDLESFRSRFTKIKDEYEINKESCLDCKFLPFCYKGNYGELYNADSSLESKFPTCHDLKNCIEFMMINHELSEKILLEMYK